jgi:hypothetical protein
MRAAECRIGVGVVRVEINGALKSSLASSLALRVACEKKSRPRSTYSHAARLLVGFARARPCSKRVSFTAAAPTTRLAISSCTAKISTTSASYASDQTCRSVGPSVNATVLPGRSPATRLAMSSARAILGRRSSRLARTSARASMAAVRRSKTFLYSQLRHTARQIREIC